MPQRGERDESNKEPRITRAELLRRGGLVVGAVAGAYAIDRLNILANATEALGGTPRPLEPGSGEASAELTIAWLTDRVRQWQGIIEAKADKYGIDPNFLAIIMTIESEGDPQAVSPRDAKGLMQIVPITEQDIVERLLNEPIGEYDIFDPETNVEFGTVYLRWLIDQVGDRSQGPDWERTVEYVAAGYNGGLGAAQSLIAGRGVTSRETYDYCNMALNMWRERHAEASPTYARRHGA